MNLPALWILNHYALPGDSAGGTRHFDFARELVKRGASVTIFSSNFLHNSRRHRHSLAPGETFRTEIIDRVTFVWLRTWPHQKNDWRRVLNMLSYTYRAVRVGSSWRPAPTAVIGSSVHPFAGLAGYLLARRHHARFFFEVRDLWPQTLIDLGYASPRHPIIVALRFMETWLYRRADKIIVLLPKAVDDITSRGIPADKVVYIPNGVQLDSTASTNGVPEAIRLFRAQRPFLVAYAGAHGLANGLDVILQAARLVKEKGNSEVGFVFIGDGPEKERLVRTAAENSLDNTLFVAPVPKMAAPSVLKEMSTLVFPLVPSPILKYGISSNKIFDYMASGRPVIFSAEAGNNPVAEAGCGVSIPPANPAALAEAILQTYRLSPDERSALGARGRQFVEQNYAVSKLVDRLCTALELEPARQDETRDPTCSQAPL
jgi:glycosyltransferase involved in cell wall biosynthesis